MPNETTCATRTDYLFTFDSSTLLPGSDNALKICLAAVESKISQGKRLQVIGFADGVGSSEYNRRLSTDRAASVRNWYVTHGVDAGAISARGAGEAGARNGVADASKRVVTVKVVE